jgi:hypothetical protein
MKLETEKVGNEMSDKTEFVSGFSPRSLNGKDTNLFCSCVYSDSGSFPIQFLKNQESWFLSGVSLKKFGGAVDERWRG